jgi:prepilin-type N-terminal cleavage/methylation domain-containing protein
MAAAFDRDSRRMRGDAGFTLAELLVTVAMVGVAFAVLVGGMFTYTTTSGTHRSQAEVQVELRRFAEAVANSAYVTCSTAYTVSNYTAPAGYSASNSVMLWNSATKAFDITPVAGCVDTGLQRVRATVARSSGFTYSESIDVVKRNPA